ncbi:MAG: RecQ family ATP-dependent DNA helicase, partial [Chloroflexi bacterium]|nr:RecQ family ATP-dependent DNA helicase [Chloroflexota bacterium]
MIKCVMPNPVSAPADLTRSLKELFGFDEFRALQREAVTTALEGRDLLLVMPTGAGKSLCFQLPAALSPGVTVVVSPLIALMRDQVSALLSRPEFARLGCACLNSGQSAEEQREVLRRLREGRVRLIYVAPERFRSSGFLDVLGGLPVARFVLDEAHCISEWGHDFRPDYLALGSMIESLGRPPVTAVTATATARVQQSIVKNLNMRSPAIFIGGFNRPNLHFSVYSSRTEQERLEKLGKALPRLAAAGGSGLVYV